MTYSLHTLNPSGDRAPSAPQGFGRFVREAALLFGFFVMTFWVLALLSHSAGDASWSYSGNDGAVRNWGGRIGAWLADLSYFLCGWSVWWIVLALARLWLGLLAQWMRGVAPQADPALAWHDSRAAFVIGITVLTAASCALEWSRLYRFEAGLSGHAGGVVGYVLGGAGERWLGFTGSGLAWIIFGVASAAWVFRFSWGHVAETSGAVLFSGFEFARKRIASAEDRAYGKTASTKRDDDATYPPGPALTPNVARPPVAAAVPVIPVVPTVPVVPVVPVVPTVPAKALARASNQASPAKDIQSLERFEPHFDEMSDLFAISPARPFAPPVVRPDILLDLPDSLLGFDPIAEPVVEPVIAKAVVPEYLVSEPDEPDEPWVSAPMSELLPVLPVSIVPAVAAVAAVVQSDRINKEIQSPFFKELPANTLPLVSLLDAATVRQETVSNDTLEMTSRMIEKKLKDFGVAVRVVLASPGPVITRYEIEPATGVKGSQIVGLAKDLARSLSLVSIRVVETIPGKNYMALELPNARRQTIKLSEILGSAVYNDAKSLLTMGLGKDIIGNPVVADLAKMPHCLVAGTTGSGKSVGINAMILSLLYKAEARDVRLLMIDPKMLEMSVYEGIPHLLAPVVTDMKQAAHGLTWCVAEMEKRYKLMSKMGVRNLAGYNTKIDEATAREQFIYNPFSLTPESPEPLDRLPHIVVVIDELADLMMVVGKKIEELIARLAQKARAAGIHLILATQRPSVDVITGLIKANIPTRIAFQVSSKIDSRTILDQMGAEALLGMGDMLYMPSGTGLPVRVHGAFVSDDEVHRVVSYLKAQGEPNYIEGVLEGGTVDGEGGAASAGEGGENPGGEKDPMFDQAVDVVLKNRKASISLVQRHLQIGYNRSARMLDDMEKAGLISPMNGRGQRDILVPAKVE